MDKQRKNGPTVSTTGSSDTCSDWSNPMLKYGEVRGRALLSAKAYYGDSTGGDYTTVEAQLGDATGGDYTAVMSSSGSATGGNRSAVMAQQGVATVGDYGIAMGRAVKIGSNAIGVIVNQYGEIMQIFISSKTKIDIVYTDEMQA